MKATSENVSFENCYPERGCKIIVQDIVFNNNVIGALVHEQSNLFNPVKMWVQVNAPENHENLFDRSYIAEDEGRIFGIFEFDNFQKYLDYVNEYKLN